VHGHVLTRLVVDLAGVCDADENAINALLDGRATALQAGSRSGLYAPKLQYARCYTAPTPANC
jgi:hypothetical protein